MGKPSDQIKIAKINAWQAILVALIGALAGVTGTAGFKYFDHTKILSEKEEAIAQLENKIARYELDLAQSPITLLRVAGIGTDLPECLKRLTTWHMAEVRKRKGPGLSMQSTSYDQNFISQFERFTVRVACPAVGDAVAVSVSILPLGNEDLDRAREITDKVIAALQ